MYLFYGLTKETNIYFSRVYTKNIVQTKNYPKHHKIKCTLKILTTEKAIKKSD